MPKKSCAFCTPAALAGGSGALMSAASRLVVNREAARLAAIRTRIIFHPFFVVPGYGNIRCQASVKQYRTTRKRVGALFFTTRPARDGDRSPSWLAYNGNRLVTTHPDGKAVFVRIG